MSFLGALGVLFALFFAAIFVAMLSVFLIATGHIVSADTSRKKIGTALRITGYVLAVPSAAVIIIGLSSFWL